MPNDLGMGYKNVRDMPDHLREFLLEVVGLYKVVKTPWSEGKRQERQDLYDYFYTTYKKAAQSGQPIIARRAELLVRFHPFMPDPLVPLALLGQASPRGGPILVKEKPYRELTFVCHSPNVIQQYFTGAGSLSDQARRTLAVLALRSDEWFKKIEAWAQTSPLCFDALNTAARLANYPHPVLFRSFPTKERLSIWKYTVDKKLIARPLRRLKGPDRFKKVTRDAFFCDTVEDLKACGLPKLRNEATDGVISACDVVARVYGVSSSTVRTVFDKFRGRSA